MIKKRIFGIGLLLILSVSTVAANTEIMSVTVKKAQVRTKPSFLGKIVYILSYTDKVEVLDERAGWFFIETDGQSDRGWIHSSALTQKRLALKSGSKNLGTTASNNEVALAGKGFNNEVEAEYRSQNDLDYTWIDKMETYNYGADEVISFLNEAGIYPREVN